MQSKKLYKQKKERNEGKMKNMKRTILGVAILAIVLIMMMGSVNAASLSASSEKISKGETVTVTVNMEPSKATEINLTYDADVFEYVSSSSSIMVTDEKGSLIATYLTSDGEATISQMSFTFKAKENSEGANFAVTGFTTDVTGDTVGNNVTVVVKDEEKPVEPVNPEQPTNPEQPANGNDTTTKTETNGSAIVGTDGKVIKKLPQTGTPVFVGAIALIVVAGAVLVARKAK